MTEPHQLVRRSQLARRGLWTVLLTDVAAVCAGVPYLYYLRSLSPDAVVADLDLAVSEAAYGLIGLAQVAALVVAAVFFIRWFQVAYANVGTLTGRATKHDPRWAIWGFLVPFLNLFRPQQMMREIWDEVYLRWFEEPARVNGLRLPGDRVNLWWGLFLVTTFVENVAGRFSWRAVTAADEVTATTAYLFSDSIDMAAAGVAVLLVRSVTELQQPFVSDVVPSESSPLA